MAELQQTLETILGGHDATQPVPFQLVRKRGRSLLLLPADSRMAAQTLALYPAQTLLARIFKRGLRMALVARFPIGMEKLSIPVSAANPLVHFFAKAASAETVPGFGVLAGNPDTPGQRFIFLLFDSDKSAKAIIKVGISEAARTLIRHEREFLSNARELPGIPRVRATYESNSAGAIAVDFVNGRSPAVNAPAEISGLLTSWILPDQKIEISETRVWRELEQTPSASQPFFKELSSTLKNKLVHPVIFHGDFAPWNIKIRPGGEWAVFDWERGDLTGLPGYDWFHYLIQTGILVQHRTAQVLADRLAVLFASAAFRDYAMRAGISGLERHLAIAYLIHHNEVVRPSEGLTEGKKLLHTLVAGLSSH